MMDSRTRRAIGLVSRVRTSIPATDGDSSSRPLLVSVASHLRTPLFRNGYALILSTGLTSGLGFVYWLLAARIYPTEVVGLNSAALSSMMFLAGLAQLSLTNVLIRFIPRASTRARSLADSAVLVTMVAGLLAALIFVWGINIWAPSLGFLQDIPMLGVAFGISTAAWGVFVLQEGILTGLRSATWVPVKNAAFSIGKIALLFAFATLLPEYGVFASWVIPALVALVPMGLLVRRRLTEGFLVAAAEPEPATLDTAHVVRYAAADYAGSLFWLAATMLVPVLVTEVAGPTANAHFYLAWTIAYTLYLVAPSMGSSLIVETAIDPARLSAYSRHAFLQTARIVVPLALVVALAAPYILGILGGAYAEEGTTLLRLLALSAIPNIVNSLYTSIARAQRRLGAIVGILASQCIAVLGMSYFLLQSNGITGVGVAWLASQSVIALVLFIARHRVLHSADAGGDSTGKA